MNFAGSYTPPRRVYESISPARPGLQLPTTESPLQLVLRDIRHNSVGQK